MNIWLVELIELVELNLKPVLANLESTQVRISPWVSVIRSGFWWLCVKEGN